LKAIVMSIDNIARELANLDRDINSLEKSITFANLSRKSTNN
jgi:hypothetical protein